MKTRVTAALVAVLGATLLVAQTPPDVPSCIQPLVYDQQTQQCAEPAPEVRLQWDLDHLPDGTIPRTVELDPDHEYILTTPLVVRHPVHLDGRGARLRVPLGGRGIHVLSNAQGSIIERLELVGYRPSGTAEDLDPGGVGLRVEAAHVVVRDVRVNAVGTAVLVLGCTGGEVACSAEEPGYGVACVLDGDCPESGRCDGVCRGRNANHVRMSNLDISRCDRGIVIHGYDASAGLYEHVNVVNCRRGILDSGFTGSTWIAPHISGIDCTGGDCVQLTEDLERYSLTLGDSTSYAVVVAPYLEGGVPPLHSRSSSVLVMGSNGAKRSHPAAQHEVVGTQASRLRFADYRYTGPGASATTLQSPMATMPAGSGILLTWQARDGGPWWRLQRVGGAAGTGSWQLSRRTSPVWTAESWPESTVANH